MPEGVERPALSARFIKRMRAEVNANSHKGDCHAWRPTAEGARSELEHHVKMMLEAVARGDRAKVSEYSADVAVIAMMIEATHGENQGGNEG
jgi:hypothetical protein